MNEDGRALSPTWPVELTLQEDGAVLVTFPDVSGALTEGATEAEALVQAQDCLVAALVGYISAWCAVPRASPTRGRKSVELPVLTLAKIALSSAMCAHGVGSTALAARLGLSEGAVRRLIDLDHRSHIRQVETALHALGQRLTVASRAA